MNTISRQELQQLIDADSVVVLEALPPMYFEAGHLPGAKNLPLDDIETLAPVLVPDRTTPVVTYCANLACQNSKIAASRLTALGYTDVRAYEGGKEDWAAAGLPVQVTSDEIDAKAGSR